MGATLLVVVLAAVFGWSLLAGGLRRSPITGPVVFVVVGVVLVLATGDLETAVGHDLKVLAEVTLVLVLFSDAGQLRAREIRPDLGLVGRLLGIGLPLSIAAGTLLAVLLFPEVGIWSALLIGAALAPTDAALGVPVVTDPSVPPRIRRLISIESGLNDGIATPVVMVAIAGVSAAETAHRGGVGAALAELAIGLTAGATLGAGAGAAMRIARRRELLSADMAGPAVLALALLTYSAALAVHGNGFIAAFVAGIAFSWGAGRRGGRDAGRGVEFVEEFASFVSMIVWLVFGGTLVLVLREGISLPIIGYAVLSLTVVRMLPVAVALLGSRLDARTVAFVGWFGPRGLASIIFALLALESLGSGANTAVAVIGVTVLLSVIAHGVTAAPLATRYGARATAGRSGGHRPPAGEHESAATTTYRAREQSGLGEAKPE